MFRAQMPLGKPTIGDRTAYAYQALIARKFNSDFSLQLMPSLVHRNMVITDYGEKNDIYALGAGARYKLTRRFSLNGEYYYRLGGFNRDLYYNSVALGVDIETGGHTAPKVIPPHCSFIKSVGGWIVTASGGVEINPWQVVAEDSRVNGQLVAKRTPAAELKQAGANHWWWD